MGCYLSKPPGKESHNGNALQEGPQPGAEIGLPQPYQDPRSIDQDNNFPLDERDIASVSAEELLSGFLTAPQLHHYGAVTVSRISKHLVIKGGPGVAKSEAENMKFAFEALQLPVPRDAKFQGPWFTDYGAGPFDTLGELEDWCNHKIDVCVMVKQLPPGTPRFEFKDIVLTHQDLAPRNLVLDKDMKLWVLDWGCAGVYPKGFEQAALQVQAWNKEYAEMVLGKLSDHQSIVIEQLADIAYGLSTGRAL
ncbi:uncharacterized protein BKA55DRAFT_672390 [Fusarium redolens]|uniref:Aminoglycoside phosphotransferase domain-containing protein n=1 Tax=Fusarium redolens TaxID=48865 RepID=A0A9P9HY91_FUSRE|nr:uncharacterized protein BKA55DRAFT_672390 [Fusarium redolens]KAH7265561.1 hypothetical protein BKA55DRAFT_672390 [Fusarium redolens]